MPEVAFTPTWQPAGVSSADRIIRAVRVGAFTLLPLGVLVAAVVALASAREPSAEDWARFSGLAVLGLLAQAFISRADRAGSGHAAAVAVLPAGAILLPLDLLVTLAFVLSIPRWVMQRRVPIRARAFGFATEVVASIAAWIASAATYALASMLLDGEGAWALAGLAACAAFVTTDQLPRLVGRTTRSAPLSVGTESLLAASGAALAAVCLTNPWLAPFAVAPLLLLRQWFAIPLLEHQATRDSKTGLFNARHFELALERELERAKLARTPLTVLLADLDLLREINNTHGHLAGDAVLRGVGDLLREQLRSQDVPARFGGEEFAVLLPATSPSEALEIAERLRSAMAAGRFPSETAGKDLQATISIGVASYPEHGSTPVRLIHQADLAVYRAKLQGRNRVLAANGAFGVEPDSPPSESLRLVDERRKSDELHAADEPSDARLLPATWPSGSRRLTTVVGAMALAALAMLGVTQASILTAMLAPAIGGVTIFLMRREARAQADRASAAVAYERAERLRRGADGLKSMNRTLERANRLLRERSAAAMETLSAAVDARDSHTAGHSRRVQTLALALGRELELSVAEQEVLGHAALFHDVGKLAVPEAILLKPDGLGDIDWRVVRRHPEEGARLIEHLGFLEDALPAIRHHHERYDGTGYPKGLAGEDIPLGARIIHLADALDAMLTSRPYRPALGPVEALEQIRSGSGAQFCPRCVDAFDRIMLAEFAKGADVPGELLAS